MFILIFLPCTACDDGKYGDGCQPCGQCTTGDVCDKVTGVCSGGCNPGYKGDYCGKNNAGKPGNQMLIVSNVQDMSKGYLPSDHDVIWTLKTSIIITVGVIVLLTLVLPEPYICASKLISDQIDSTVTQVAKMFCGRRLVRGPPSITKGGGRGWSFRTGQIISPPVCNILFISHSASSKIFISLS